MQPVHNPHQGEAKAELERLKNQVKETSKPGQYIIQSTPYKGKAQKVGEEYDLGLTETLFFQLDLLVNKLTTAGFQASYNDIRLANPISSKATLIEMEESWHDRFCWKMDFYYRGFGVEIVSKTIAGLAHDAITICTNLLLSNDDLEAVISYLSSKQKEIIKNYDEFSKGKQPPDKYVPLITKDAIVLWEEERSELNYDHILKLILKGNELFIVNGFQVVPFDPRKRLNNLRYSAQLKQSIKNDLAVLQQSIEELTETATDAS